MNDEAPLSLAALAETDSPDVVRGALAQFRRRMLARVILFPIAAALIIVVPKLLPGMDPSIQKQFQESGVRQYLARAVPAGPVLFRVMEARRLDETFALRFFSTTDALRPEERLTIEGGYTGILHDCEREQPSNLPGPPVGPIAPLSLSGGEARDVVEGLIVCPLGAIRLTLEIGAVYVIAEHAPPAVPGEPPGPPDPSGGAGPGRHTQEECAVPLNPLNVCAFLKSQGTYRTIATITLDMRQLGVEDAIWRVEP